VNAFETLRYSKIIFSCGMQESAGRLPSALWWRENLERQFRRVCCVASQRECPGCPVRKSCMVTFFFTPELYLEGKKNFKGSAPLPFAAHYPDKYIKEAAGDGFKLGLTLFGPAIEKFPYWMIVLERLGSGKRLPFTISRAWAETATGPQDLFVQGDETVSCRPGATEPSAAGFGPDVSLSFVTPLRLMKHKKPLVAPDFRSFLESILQRFQNLNHFYGDSPAPASAEAVLAGAENVQMQPGGFRWCERSVYSRSQKKTIAMGGLLGQARFTGDPAPFEDMLMRGADWGIGKGTALGLGRYSIIDH